MRIGHMCSKEEQERTGQKRIIITKFKKCTIFGKHPKIVYRKSDNNYVIEYMDAENWEDSTSVIEGPDADSIVEKMIKVERARGATLIWSGARYELWLTKDALIDFVEDEEERKDRLKNQNEEE